MTPYYERDGITLYCGDSLEVAPELDAESVSAVVTDPPAGISFMGEEWDGSKGGRDNWVAWLSSVMSGCERAMKPGAHALVWALPRTSGWTHRAIEDAGLDVRDCVTHLYGSGFPKSHNLSGDWQGWGTALKPGAEFWYLARKPLSGTVAANVLAHGTGALNIDACRIGTDGGTKAVDFNGPRGNGVYGKGEGSYRNGIQDIGAGRWPANVLLDEDVAEGKEWSRYFYTPKASRKERNAGLDGMPESMGLAGALKPLSDPRMDREQVRNPQANHHPTVKPLALMRYLITLVTPPGGIVLDPFAGSGSTLVACAELGIPAIGIELSEEYCEIIARRVDRAQQRTQQAVLV